MEWDLDLLLRSLQGDECPYDAFDVRVLAAGKLRSLQGDECPYRGPLTEYHVMLRSLQGDE
ncbi:hypothetical protein ABGB13_44705 [Nonomuraea sp. B10E8]